jgi:hypothetical protein
MTKAEDKAADVAQDKAEAKRVGILGDPTAPADTVQSSFPPPIVPMPPVDDHHTASQKKSKNWEPLSTNVAAVSFSSVKTDYVPDSKKWNVIVGFATEADAKLFYDAMASDQVMLMRMSAANLLAMQLAKPVPGAPAPEPVVV